MSLFKLYMSWADSWFFPWNLYLFRPLVLVNGTTLPLAVHAPDLSDTLFSLLPSPPPARAVNSMFRTHLLVLCLSPPPHLPSSSSHHPLTPELPQRPPHGFTAGLLALLPCSLYPVARVTFPNINLISTIPWLKSFNCFSLHLEKIQTYYHGLLSHCGSSPRLPFHSHLVQLSPRTTMPQPHPSSFSPSNSLIAFLPQGICIFCILCGNTLLRFS